MGTLSSCWIFILLPQGQEIQPLCMLWVLLAMGGPVGSVQVGLTKLWRSCGLITCVGRFTHVLRHTLSLPFLQFSLSLKHTPHTVYLRTSPEVCYKRVQERGREEEKTVNLVRAIDTFSS